MPRKVAVPYEDPKKVGPYAEALRLVGIEPVLFLPDGEWALKGLDGLLLTGGRDIDPACYGQEPAPEAQQPNPARDRMEIGLLGQALERDLPVLAICRGHQLFNIYHGGTLLQHLKGDPHRTPKPPADPSKPLHQVIIEPGTRLAAMLGAGALAVNSRHHQAVDKVGAHLTVSARAVGDGIVEGLERADRRFAVAVQWHPEDQVKSSDAPRKLFQGFADAMGGGA